MRIRLTRRSLIIALLALLAYPAIANVMILTGAAQVLANIKPQKLTMSWESAWTLLPGRFVVSGLEFQSTTPRNQFSLVVDTGKVSVSVVGLLSRTVAITQAEAAGVEVRYAKVTGVSQSSSANAKPPWTIKLDNVSATGIRKAEIQNLTGVDDMTFLGSGTLDTLKMSIVTKGGLMQVDRAVGSMVIDNQTGAKNDGAPLRIDADLSIASHRPRQYKGKEKLQFFTGTINAKGNFASIGPVSFLPDSELNLTTKGEGDLEAQLQIESGELMPGSQFTFESDSLKTTFLQFEATGNGTMKASVDSKRNRPVAIQIELDAFQIAEPGDPAPYLSGSDLNIEGEAHRLLLYSQKGDGTGALSFHIDQGLVEDIQHYNKFIPSNIGLKFLSGSASTRGGFSIDSGVAHGLIEVSGTGVTLSAQDREIEADFHLSANLSEGDWRTRRFRLNDSTIRLEKVKVSSKAKETDEDWWGEVEIERGQLVWQEPFDLSAKMRLAMRDVEPLLHMFRDPEKKKSKIDEFLNVKNVEGQMLAQSRDEEIHIDPLHIDSDGLEVISKLSLSRDTANGVLYAKFKKVSAHFEIVDKSPRMIGFGGRKKILQEVDLSRLEAKP
ncbi:MAG: hypothetical protein ACPHIX_05360 [Arenicellales bacterium]